MILYDKNGREVTGFEIGEDGVVYGNMQPKASLSKESCTFIRQKFINDECVWKTQEMEVFKKVLITPIEQNEIKIKEKTDCNYYFEIDYLLYINTANLENVIDISRKIGDYKIDIVLLKEKEIFNEVSIEFELDERSIYDKLTTESPSGIYVDGNVKFIKDSLEEYINNDIDDTKLKSIWITKQFYFQNHMDIEDTIIGFRINNPITGFYLKIDNIKLIESCERGITYVRHISKNPSFNLERIIDNKKSWVDTDVKRKYIDVDNVTNYEVDNDKLVINTKEIELNLSITKQIGEEIKDSIKINQKYIDNLYTLNPTLFDKLNFTDDEIDTVKQLMLFIFTKYSNSHNYRTVFKNVVVDSILFEYMKGTTVNYENGYSLIDKISSNWGDIVEQMIPSTAIWGATTDSSNLIIGSDKYQYKKYGLVPDGLEVISPIINVEQYDVNGDKLNNINVGINYYNLGSEFYNDLNYNDNIPQLMKLQFEYKGFNNVNFMCDYKPLNLKNIYCSKFEVNQQLYIDRYGNNKFEPTIEPMLYFFISNNINYGVTVSVDGTILKIEKVPNCKALSTLKYFNQPFTILESMCDFTTNTLYDLYYNTFAIGNQLYTTPDGLNEFKPYNSTNFYYYVVNNGTKHAIYIDVNGIIREIHAIPKCSAVTNGELFDFGADNKYFYCENEVNEFITLYLKGLKVNEQLYIDYDMLTPYIPNKEYVGKIFFFKYDKKEYLIRINDKGIITEVNNMLSCVVYSSTLLSNENSQWDFMACNLVPSRSVFYDKVAVGGQLFLDQYGENKFFPPKADFYYTIINTSNETNIIKINSTGLITELKTTSICPLVKNIVAKPSTNSDKNLYCDASKIINTSNNVIVSDLKIGGLALINKNGVISLLYTSYPNGNYHYIYSGDAPTHVFKLNNKSEIIEYFPYQCKVYISHKIGSEGWNQYQSNMFSPNLTNTVIYTETGTVSVNNQMYSDKYGTTKFTPNSTLVGKFVSLNRSSKTTNFDVIKFNASGVITEKKSLNINNFKVYYFDKTNYDVTSSDYCKYTPNYSNIGIIDSSLPNNLIQNDTIVTHGLNKLMMAEEKTYLDYANGSGTGIECGLYFNPIGKLNINKGYMTKCRLSAPYPTMDLDRNEGIHDSLRVSWGLYILVQEGVPDNTIVDVFYDFSPNGSPNGAYSQRTLTYRSNMGSMYNKFGVYEDLLEYDGDESVFECNTYAIYRLPTGDVTTEVNYINQHYIK